MVQPHNILNIKVFLCFVFVALCFPVLCQSTDTIKSPEAPIKQKDPKYLDDQIYAGFTYNILTSKPKDLSTYGLSNSLSFGYIRDLPLNDRRNFGLGVGLGFNFSAYYNNLLMMKTPEGISQTKFLKQGDYKTNYFSTQSLEIPIQIRYRTSTASKFNFWRVYAGITPSWVFRNYSTHDNNLIKTRYYNIRHIANFLCSANLQIGYGKFNLKVDYTFTPLFDATDEMKQLGMQNVGYVSVGLLVYFI